MASSRFRAGQSLLEVLIAVAILAMMATGSFALVGVTVSESQIAAQQADARNIAEEGLEAARQIRNEDFALLTAGTHGLSLTGGTWTFAGTSDTTDQYTRTITITQVDENQRDVRVTVDWEARPGRELTYTESTRFADWVNAPIPSASNCDAEGSASGNWALPVVLGSADIGSGNSGTDVVVKWPYAYVSGTASSSSKPDLFIFDVTNTASPSLVRSVDTGASGINSLFLLGNYIYAASSNDSREFQIFDITTPTATSLIASANLSGSANALAVIAAGEWVALGRAQSSSSEVIFYDVSNPLIPSVVGSFSEPDDINDFTTDGTNVFTISSDAQEDIVMFDMTNPLVPVRALEYDLHDLLADLSISYHDPGKLLVGNEGGQLVVVDATDVENMSLQSTYNAGGMVQDIFCVTNDYAFAGTTNSTKEFQIFNLSNLDAITLTASLNFPQMATGVDFYNNMVFVSVRSNDALRIITSTP